MTTTLVIKALIEALESSNQYVAAWGNLKPGDGGGCNSFAKRQLERANQAIEAGNEWLANTPEIADEEPDPDPAERVFAGWGHAHNCHYSGQDCEVGCDCGGCPYFRPMRAEEY